MKNEFVPYEEALALKELGMTCVHFGGYSHPELPDFPKPFLQTSDEGEWDITAPLYQQAFRWFREKYKLVSEIQAPDGKDGVWHPTIHKAYGFGNHYDNNGFNTYEEAQDACLRKLIEIVNQNKDE